MFLVIPLLFVLSFLLLELLWCRSRIVEYYQRYYMIFSWQECIRPHRVAGVRHGLLIGHWMAVVGGRLVQDRSPRANAEERRELAELLETL